jgi:hypothetical protein
MLNDKNDFNNQLCTGTSDGSFVTPDCFFKPPIGKTDFIVVQQGF